MQEIVIKQENKHLQHIKANNCVTAFSFRSCVLVNYVFVFCAIVIIAINLQLNKGGSAMSL